MARPRRNPDLEVLIATVSGVFYLKDGSEVIVRRGITRAHRGHEVVQTTPDWWEPIPVHYAVSEEPRAEA